MQMLYQLFQFCRWFPECEYVLQKKGEEYVNEVHARTPANKKVGQAHHACVIMLLICSDQSLGLPAALMLLYYCCICCTDSDLA